MTNLDVSRSHDYSGEDLSDVTEITFTELSRFPATATFAGEQFAPSSLQDGIAYFLKVHGNGGTNAIVIHANYVTAPGWSFTNWSDDDSITFVGTGHQDTLVGTVEDDAIYGGGGSDSLSGDGTGNDSVYGGDGKDSLSGALGIGDGGDGVDTFTYLGNYLNVTPVAAHIDIAGGGRGDNFGTGLSLTSIEILEAYGSALNDFFAGASRGDSMFGAGGEDTLMGRNGDDALSGYTDNDTLSGGNGQDTLTGGAGTDRMTGGSGADVFVWTQFADFGPGVNRDLVTDFVPHTDHIDLHGFDANPDTPEMDHFDFIRQRAFESDALVPQLRFYQTATYTIIQMDVTGDGVADYEILLKGVLTLTAGDFTL